MKFFNIRRFIARGSSLLLALSAALSTISCEQIFDSEGDCSVTYQVVFTQTRNIVGADAFPVRVKSVSFFVFTPDDKFVLSKTESGAALASGDYVMELSGQEIAPGTYDVIVWAGLSENDTWELGTNAPTSKKDLICRLERTYVDNEARSQQQLTDLFHGAERIVIPGHVYGNYRIERTIDLTKNNNKLRIILQHYNGREMNKDDFHFLVQDSNGKMNYDNAILDDELITYREYFKESAMVATPVESRADGEITSITSVVAELDVARLMADRNPLLIVEVEGKDKPVLKLPLVDLLLNAKGPYAPQDFLDRQDEYNLIFYLDDGYGWYTQGGVWVNSWHVIYQDKEL